MDTVLNNNVNLKSKVLNHVVHGIFNDVTQEVSPCPGFYLKWEFHFIIDAKEGSDFSDKCSISYFSQWTVLEKIMDPIHQEKP